MKCCCKNLSRNQTDPGICWSFPPATVAKIRTAIESNLRSVYIEEEDPSTWKILVVWFIFYMQKSRSVRLAIAVSDLPPFLCGLSLVQRPS